VNILRFEMNVPAEVALQSSEGVSVEGRYGTRTMFTLTDGRVMYVPPIVASKIESAGIAPGEAFQLCKASVKTRQRRSVEWLVERINPDRDQHPANECTSTSTAESSLEDDLRLSVEMANARRAGLPPTEYIEEITSFPSNSHISNGRGLKIVPSGSSAPITKLEQALKTAISAAHNAEKFGSELGYVVRFDADAIKSMAITVLINMSERVQR
jgi:hypothetical protein